MPWNFSFSPILAQAAQAADAAARQSVEWFHQPWFVWLMILVSLVVAIAIGRGMARSYRMPDYDWKISLILFTLFAGVIVTTLRWPPKLGIDLSGGVILVYETQGNEVAEVEARMRRLLTTENETYDVKTDDRNILITVPDGTNDRIKAVEEKINSQSFGEFTVARQDVLDGTNSKTLRYRVDRPAESRKLEMDKLVAAVSRRINPSGVKEITIRPVGGDKIEVIIPEASSDEVELTKRQISTAGKLVFRIVANTYDHADIIERAQALSEKEKEVIDNGQPVAMWVNIDPRVKRDHPEFPTRRVSADHEEVLVVIDDQTVTGDFLVRASAGYDQSGTPNVNFSFNSEGAQRFSVLTSSNLPQGRVVRQLGILLDNRLQSAPNIQSTISDSGQITGSFTQEEVDFLVGVLNAGSLPTALNPKPISQQQISAQLGEDTVRKGEQAMAASLVVVLAFMFIYYRLSGTIAVAVLLLNLLLTVALMIVIKAAFTLPGLAGLVLGVAMCVDSNVLIYERLREEMDRGAGLRMAIRNAFARSARTIIDSHVTTLITAVILYWIGSELIRSFAVTLFIGLVLNLYTAVFCSRVIFDIGEKRRWFSQLNMMRMFAAPKLDFMAMQRYFVPLSLALIVLSIVGIVMRGQGLFDIDFTGGTSVQMVFKADKPLDVSEVRRKLAEGDELLEDVAVSRVFVETDAGEEEERAETAANTQFKIDTSNDDINEVQKILQAKFGDHLATYAMSYDQIAAIPGPAADPGIAPPTRSGATTTPGDPAAPATTTPAAPAAPATTTSPATATPPGTATPPASSTPPATPATPAAPAGTPADPATTDAKPAAPATPPSDTPAGESNAKPDVNAETDTPETPKPEADKAESDPEKKPAESGSDAPAGSVLRQALRTGEQLALADEPAAKTDDTKTEDAAKPEAAAEKSPASPATAADSKAEGASAPGAPTATADAKPESATADTATTTNATSATTTPATTTPAATTGPATASGSAPAGASATATTDVAKPSASDAAFAGGAKARLTFPNRVNYSALKNMIDLALHSHPAFKFAIPNYEISNPQYESGSSHAYEHWDLRIAASEPQLREVLETLRTTSESTPVFLSANEIGGRVAADTKTQAIIAVLISSLFIAGYIWFRFQDLVFGLGAMVALVHDVIIPIGAIAWSFWLANALGFLGIEQFKISLPVLAGVLTLIGYALNDTIVICDRIREVRGKSHRITADIVNQSINQTLSRTMLTGLTVILVILILYIAGGQGIHAFSFVMLVGVIVGTYGSVFVAAPLLVWLHKPRGEQVNPRVAQSTSRSTSKV